MQRNKDTGEPDAGKLGTSGSEGGRRKRSERNLAGGLPYPSGTVTFLFTDIEGSTLLLQGLGNRYPAVLEEHRRLLRAAFAARGGHEVGTHGDAFFVVFSRATDALAACLEGQRALAAYVWPEGAELRVRMGLHTGEAVRSGNDYAGLEVHRAARIGAAAHGGQVLLSQATAELVREVLTQQVSLRDLGEHRLKDLPHPLRLFQLVVEELPSEFPSLNAADLPPNNLPSQLTSFVGREREVAGIRRLLGSRPVPDEGGTTREAPAHEARLITLSGPGGCGKTRLALQVAEDLLGEFPDGAYLVSLEAVTEAVRVPSATAQALNLREEASRPPAESLRQHLREKRMLLLFDNFEQVLPAARFVLDLLAACPRLKVLVTSREPLHLRGEREFPVPPLLEGASVALFIERALEAEPDFAVTPENVRAIAEICVRLDGLPLAIELAAARIKLLPPQAMLPRLESRLKLLTGGARDLPQRQQTLRQAIAWSYDLLRPEEQALFARLAIFVGGWTLEAAEAVCGEPEGRRQKAEGSPDAPSRLPSAFCLLPSDILDLLGSLVDKSLVRREDPADGNPRFSMLGTIREYALDRLAAGVEMETLRRAHAAFFLALAEEAEAHLRGPEQALWLMRLQQDHDNLRAAMDGCVSEGRRQKAEGSPDGGSTGSSADAPVPLPSAFCLLPSDAETALRLAAALWRFWHVRGHLREGRERLEAALALPGAAGRTVARARALDGAGALAHDQGDLRRARVLHEESLAIAREGGDRETMAGALNNLGNAALDEGQPHEAAEHYSEALALRRETGNRQGIATVLNNLGGVAQEEGDDAQAIAYFEESLALRRQIGDLTGIATVLNNLGYLAIRRQAPERAAMLLEESLQRFEQLGDRPGIAMALSNLADLNAGQCDAARAAGRYRECLQIWKELENGPAIAAALEGLAVALATLGHPLPAARLYGAAAALRDALGAPRPDNERAAYDRQLAEARARAEDDLWESAWADGRTLALSEAVDVALAADAGDRG